MLFVKDKYLYLYIKLNTVTAPCHECIRERQASLMICEEDNAKPIKNFPQEDILLDRERKYLLYTTKIKMINHHML